MKIMTREEKISYAKSLLQEEGCEVILKDKPLSDERAWLAEYIQCLSRTMNINERKARLEELENHEFND